MDYPNIHVTIDRKVNLGNYESASVSIGLSRVPVGATAEQIDQMLETAGLAYKRLASELNAKVQLVRSGTFATEDELSQSSIDAQANLKEAVDKIKTEAFAGRA